MKEAPFGREHFQKMAGGVETAEKHPRKASR